MPSKKRGTKPTTQDIAAHETVVVTDGRQYRRARYSDLLTALFRDPEAAEWAFNILAPVLGPILRDHPEADADFKQLTDEDFREAFYTAVLGVPFLSKNLRRAVMAELGRSYRKEKETFERYRLSVAAQLVIPEIAERLVMKGEPPSSGTTYEDAAIIEVAKKLRTIDGTGTRKLKRKKNSFGGLKRRLQRLMKSEKETAPEKEPWASGEWDYLPCLQALRLAPRAGGFYVERRRAPGTTIEQRYGPFRTEAVAKVFMRDLAEADATARMSIYPADAWPKFPPDDLEAYEARIESYLK